MPLILIFLLISAPLIGQNSAMPFELERYGYSEYNSDLESLSSEFSTETEAMNYYFTAYKAQRAQNPKAYFIAPNAQRNVASDYLRTNYPEGPGMALVNFLEKNGDLASCAIILAQPASNTQLLPYQYLAALLLKREHQANENLNKMMAQGMISEVAVAFGENAVNSFNDGDLVITQGLQDLIAIEYALLNSDKKIEMKNHFLEQISSYDKSDITTTLRQADVSAWVSPSVSTEFYTTYISRLWSAGIGMRYVHGPNPNPETATNILRYVGANFEGLKSIPSTPADSGLISSYTGFATKFENLATLEVSPSLKKKAKKITKYVGH